MEEGVETITAIRSIITTAACRRGCPGCHGERALLRNLVDYKTALVTTAAADISREFDWSTACRFPGSSFFFLLIISLSGSF